MTSSADLYVSFGADTGGLEAAMAVAKAQVQALVREMASLGREMVKTGAAADSELGQRMRALGGSIAEAKARSTEISGSLSGLAGGLEHVGEAATKGHTGIAFYAREVHALLDEFSSGRVRQGEGTFLNLAFTFLQANTALIPFAAAAAAAAGILGYLGYQAVSADSAMKSIELDAVIAGFSESNEQASALRDTIEQLARVSASDAEEIAKPFIALGPAGIEIITQLAPHLASLAKEMGQTQPEAAKKLAEAYAHLGTEGRALVVKTGGAEAGLKFDAAKTSAERYQMEIDAMIGKLSVFEQQQTLATAALQDSLPALETAESGVMGLANAHSFLVDKVASARDQIARQSATVAASRARLAGMGDAQRDFNVEADKAVDKFNPLAKQIADTERNIDLLKRKMLDLAGGLTFGSTADLGVLRNTTEALKQSEDHLRKLHEEQNDPLHRSASQQDAAEIKRMADTASGAQLDLLNKELATEKARAANANSTAEERAAAEEHVRALVKQINQAGYADEKYADDLKIVGAKKTAAEMLEIRRKEQAAAGSPVAGLGVGSAAERAAALEVAGAQKALREEQLADAMDASQQQVKDAQDASKQQIADIAALAKEHGLSEQQKVAQTLAALDRELDAEQDAIAREMQMYGLSTQQRRTLNDQIEQLARQSGDKVANIQREAAEKTAEEWKSAADKIAGVVNGQVDGILRGTETVGQAFTKMAAGLIEDAIKYAVTWVAEHMAAVAAVKIGDAAAVFGGVYANLAPALGPFAAGPATASAAAVASADIGMWRVPYDGMPVVAHRNELIAPPTMADNIRQIASGGGGGDTHLHFHGAFFDPAGIAKVVNNHNRMNPSAQPRTR